MTDRDRQTGPFFRPLVALLPALVIALAPAAGAQPLQSGPGNDILQCVTPVEGGRFAVAGRTSSSIEHDLSAMFALLDEDGDVLIDLTFSPEDWTEFRDIVQLADGSLVAVGATGDPRYEDYDIYVVKLTADGDVVWAETYGTDDEDGAEAVLPDGEGGVYVAGFTLEAEANRTDMICLRIDAQGSELWDVRFGGNRHESAVGIARAAENRIVLAGSTTSGNDDHRDAYLVCIDDGGNEVWSDYYVLPYPQDGSAVAATGDGGVLVTGVTFPDEDSDETDLLLLRVNDSGQMMWVRHYGGPGLDIGTGIVRIPGGGFYVSGRWHNVAEQQTTGWLLRVDALGDTLWTQRFGGGGWDQFNDVALRDESTYVAVGMIDRGDEFLTDYMIVDEELGGAEENPAAPPSTQVLLDSYPNPFNGTAVVTLELPHRAGVDLRVYNIRGRLVARPASGVFPAGELRVSYIPGAVAGGIYFLHAVVDGRPRATRKLIYLP